MEINFKKVHTGKDLTVSGIVLAVGVGLCFVHAGLGGFIGVCGLLMLLFYKSGYKANGSGLLLTKKALDVSHSCRQSIADYLDGKDTVPELNQPGAGGVVRLEVYFNREAGLAYAQLFDFSSYTYEKASEIVEIRSPRADRLISKL